MPLDQQHEDDKPRGPLLIVAILGIVVVVIWGAFYWLSVVRG